MSDSDLRSGAADRVAFLVSAAFSPYVVLAVFVLLLVGQSAEGVGQVAAWTGIAVAGLVGVPLVYIFVGIRRGRITDIHVGDRKQRSGPFLAAMLGAALAALGLRVVGAPGELQLAAAAVVVNGVLFTLISLRWKISMHPSVFAACLVMAGMLIHPGWFLLFLALPLLMWARVRRQRHDWAQGVAATLLATVMTAAMVGFYLAHRTQLS